MSYHDPDESEAPCGGGRSAQNDDAAGLAGSIRFHQVRHDEMLVLNALGKAKFILDSEVAPEPRDTCEWCIVEPAG